MNKLPTSSRSFCGRTFALLALFAAVPACGPGPDEGPVEAPTLVADGGTGGTARAADAGPADDAPAVIYLGPGSLRVSWVFPGAEVGAGCASRGASLVRLSVGLEAPIVAPCTEAAHLYEDLPAGQYSVQLELLGASGGVLATTLGAAVVAPGDTAALTLGF